MNRSHNALVELQTSFPAKTFLVIGLLFGLVGNCLSFQGEISIDSKVDKSTITIGDLIKYTVTVTRSPEINLDVPELAANLGAFEIRDYSVHAPAEEYGTVLDRVDYTISTFDVGDFEIPPLVYHYSFPGDSTLHELATQKIKIHVKSLEPSEAGDIRDIKQPVPIERDYRKLIIWTSVAVAFLVLLAISLYIWRRQRAGKGILPIKVEPPRPADQVAWEELRILQESTLLQEGRIKEYYVCVSEIIRRYIEGRYFVVALEMTSYELTNDLLAADVEPENVERIRRFLEVCDLVKFAKFQPGDEQHQSVMTSAFEIVERTKVTYDLPASGTDDDTEATPASADEASSPAEKITEKTGAGTE